MPGYAVQVSLPTGTHSAGGVVPAGALSSYTGRLMSSRSFKSVRDVAKAFNKLLPSNIQNVNAKIDEYARGMGRTPLHVVRAEVGVLYGRVCSWIVL